MPNTSRNPGETRAARVRVGRAPPATETTSSAYFAIARKLRLWSRKSSKLGSATRDGLPLEVTSKIATMRSGSG